MPTSVSYPPPSLLSCAEGLLLVSGSPVQIWFSKCPMRLVAPPPPPPFFPLPPFPHLFFLHHFSPSSSPPPPSPPLLFPSSPLLSPSPPLTFLPLLSSSLPLLSLSFSSSHLPFSFSASPLSFLPFRACGRLRARRHHWGPNSTEQTWIRHVAWCMQDQWKGKKIHSNSK